MSSEALLIFSDVHLGSDLNDHETSRAFAVRGARSRPRRAHRSLRKDAAEELTRWRIVIAGDFIDFIGMAIMPSGRRAPDGAERGRARARAGKLVRSRAREGRARGRAAHGRVRGARRVSSPTGTRSRSSTATTTSSSTGTTSSRRSKSSPPRGARSGADGSRQGRVRRANRFQPVVFLRRERLAYIEHGHQYDEFCATEDFMAPLSPARSAAHRARVLRRAPPLRRPARRRPARARARAHGAHRVRAFGARLGFRGMVAPVRAIRRRGRRALPVAPRVLLEPRARCAKSTSGAWRFSPQATRIGIERLRALAALQVAARHAVDPRHPRERAARSPRARASLVRPMVIVAACRRTRGSTSLSPARASRVAWLLAHRYLTKRRKLDPDEQLVERAEPTGAPVPRRVRRDGAHARAHASAGVADGAATYINVGSWAEEEPEEGSATRTHLVISVRDGKAVAELRTWSAEGPRQYTFKS